MKISDAVLDFIKDNGWSYDSMSEPNRFEVFVNGHNTTVRLTLNACNEKQYLLVWGALPNKIPEPNRQAVGEFLHRVNYRLRAGNFEMNYNDGEVLFRMFIDVEDMNLSRAVLERVIVLPVLMLDRYYIAIMAICFGDDTPEQAFEKN